MSQAAPRLAETDINTYPPCYKARSTVYMVTSNDASAVDTYNNIEKPTIGLDAFSMVLSHMTDTADCHPIQHMQQAYKQETIAGAKAVWNNRAAWWSHAQDDVFERKLDNGLFLVVSGMDASEGMLQSDVAYALYYTHIQWQYMLTYILYYRYLFYGTIILCIRQCC